MRVAVLLPCHNEERSIGTVVGNFRRVLPEAEIYVYDNVSTDRTSEVAAAAGAIVRQESLKGKGNVVRRMFADIEADAYILCDGDDTYDAVSAPKLVDRLIADNLDMVVAIRREIADTAYRRGHRLGNWLLTSSVTFIFGRGMTDMLSGYRVFSRRFVKSFAALSSGFEIETEMTVHALALRVPMAEIETAYGTRSEGSSSKLRTYRDGLRILGTIFKMFREEKPLSFFSLGSAILAFISIVLGVPIVVEFMETGLVPRFPTAILATGIMILAFLSLTAGFVLDSVMLGRREAKRLNYLGHAAPSLSSRGETPSRD
ncbi:MAG TPA: glycosyltransferase family 2 protein [Magnetospirillaceae bacterium]|jgi:glycosyltransferase involved in cell wall biosynthesis